jgi:uncharacterized OsmC-like protein
MTSPTTFKPLFDQTQAALRGDPDAAIAVFSAQSRGVAGLHRKARLRDFELDVDEPPALGGEDRGPNPVELILAALATCQEITYRLYADSLGIPLDDVSVTLVGRLDLRGLFNAGEDIRPGFQEITGTVSIDSSAGPEALARLKSLVDAHCPVLDLLRHPTPVSLSLATTSEKSVAAA